MMMAMSSNGRALYGHVAVIYAKLPAAK